MHIEEKRDTHIYTQSVGRGCTAFIIENIQEDNEFWQYIRLWLISTLSSIISRFILEYDPMCLSIYFTSPTHVPIIRNEDSANVLKITL